MEGVEYITTKNGGVIKLPPGFRFRPTDEELVTQYLRRKVASLPLPATVILEVDLWKHSPWDLHGGKGEKYFFTTLEDAKRSRGNKSVIRTASSGFWKAKGKPKPIISSSRGGRMIGTKTTFVFHRQDETRSHKVTGASCTNWMMEEYQLPNIGALSRYIRENAAVFNGILPLEMKDWVVCKIFQKGSTSSSTKRVMNKQEIVLQESSNGNLVPSVSLAISCVTNLDDDEKEKEEEEEISS